MKPITDKSCLWVWKAWPSI